MATCTNASVTIPNTFSFSDIGISLPETEYPAYSAGTYNTGDRVIVLSTHKIYESLTDSNVLDPVTGSETTVPVWLVIGYTNPYRMFDNSVGTVTAHTSDLTFTITSGLMNTISLLNLIGKSVTITMVDPTEGTVYTKSVPLVDYSNITSWWAWYFGELPNKTSLTFASLPTYPNAVTTVTIEAVNGVASCGSCVYGTQLIMGKILGGARTDLVDYSVKSTDQFGNTVITERAFSKTATVAMRIPSAQIDKLFDDLTAIRAIPSVYTLEKTYSTLTIYGYHRNVSIVFNNRQSTIVDLTIEGLI